MVKYRNFFTKHMYNKKRLALNIGVTILLTVVIYTIYLLLFKHPSINHINNQPHQDDFETILNEPNTTLKHSNSNHVSCKGINTEALSKIIGLKIIGLQELAQTEEKDKNKVTICGFTAETSGSGDDISYVVQLTIRNYSDKTERDSKYTSLMNSYKYVNENDIIIDKASRSAITKVGDMYIASMTIANSVDSDILDHNNNDLRDWLLGIRLE
ncbi:MAG TPA: hypothetical protein PKA29_03705 [Candidatus Saccharibacteria bacterium]|nr:hypothetical protein [Candidatus Saccharibacteria bacterium]